MKIRTVFISLLAAGVAVSISYAETGKAVIAGTKTGSTVSGTVMLTDAPGGLQVDASISGAPPGNHAFHIHENGLCDDEGKAAGGHYNPAGHPHGDMLKEGIDKTHAGDFGNLTIGSDGKGTLHAIVPGLTLSGGKYNVAGRAFILHEKADDFSQPVGNAGSRIGCGPILITGK